MNIYPCLQNRVDPKLSKHSDFIILINISCRKPEMMDVAFKWISFPYQRDFSQKVKETLAAKPHHNTD